MITKNDTLPLCWFIILKLDFKHTVYYYSELSAATIRAQTPVPKKIVFRITGCCYIHVHRTRLSRWVLTIFMRMWWSVVRKKCDVIQILLAPRQPTIAEVLPFRASFFLHLVYPSVGRTELFSVDSY